MRTRLIVLMAVLMVAAVPAAALAQTDEPATRDTVVNPDSGRDLSQLRERGLEAIERRLETIERLRQRIDDSDHLTGEHFGQLTAELARHEAGLEQLAREIEAAETGAELLAIAPKIVTEHRIYVLVVPKVAEVIGSDTGVAFAARGEEVAGVLSTWIERLADLGRDVSEGWRRISPRVSRSPARSPTKSFRSIRPIGPTRRGLSWRTGARTSRTRGVSSVPLGTRRRRSSQSCGNSSPATEAGLSFPPDAP
jgi:hypothetical protein